TPASPLALPSCPHDALPISVPSAPIGDNLALTGDKIGFANPERAATDPTAWLALFETALERNAQASDAALELIRAQAGRLSADRSEEHTSELQSRVDLVCRL